MNKETLTENYTAFSTEKLISIVSEINYLKPESLSLLQKELINRNENEVALSITEYLISIKYHISESVLFESILQYRNNGLTEVEINDRLKEEHNIDLNYLELIRLSLKEKGKENIAVGVAMIIIPLILGILLLIEEAFIGVFPILLVGIGVWRLNKGIKQKKES